MRKSIIVAVIAMLLPLLCGAQALKGSYFMDNSVNRHNMNPAFAPRANYFKIPVAGNVATGAVTNLDIPTFLYPSGDQLLTFLHKDVSLKQFDRALPNRPHIDADMHSDILSFGFYNKNKAFWTFDLSVRSGVDVDVPRDLFMFVKKGAGTSGETFNIANVNAYATASVSAALGYSRQVMKGLRVGAKVRFIAPVAYAGINLENVRLTTGTDKWTAETEGYAYAAMQGLEINTPADEVMPEIGFNMDNFINNKALAGFGYSVDLGVDWKLEVGSIFDGLSVSAAVTDLGMIHYDTSALSMYSTSGSVDWVGFQDVNMDNTDFEAIMNDFVSSAQEELLHLDQEETPSKFVKSTMPRFYAGLEVPFLWRRMSVGLLYSGRMSHSYYRQELTASYNLKPLKWLALGVNYSFLNTAQTLGGIFEFTPRSGLNFHIGLDYLPVAWTPAPILDDMLEMPDYFVQKGHVHPYLPLSMRLNLQFGMSMVFKSRHGR